MVSKPNKKGEFLRDNLPRIKDQAYFINLNDKQMKGTHYYLLTDIWFCTMILLEFDIFDKSKINQRYINQSQYIQTIR